MKTSFSAQSAYLQGRQSANNLCKRLDRKNQKSECNEKYGWKKGAQGKCVRVKQEEQGGRSFSGAEVANILSKNKKEAFVVGASTATVLGGAALALPLIELSKIKTEEVDGTPIPKEGISQERLMNYNNKFERGDMINYKFNLPLGLQGRHYGIYLGPDKKTGEPMMLHYNPVEKGIGVTVTSLRTPNAAVGIWEYEKSSVQAENKEDVERRLKKIKPYIGKSSDFNIFDSNCEAFARAIIGKSSVSQQTAQLSKVGRAIGRTAIGSPITLSRTKGRKPETTLKEITDLLNEGVKETTKSKIKKDSKQKDSGLPWEIFFEGDALISPKEALQRANIYKQKELAVGYLKGYLLTLGVTRYVVDKGGSNDPEG